MSPPVKQEQTETRRRRKRFGHGVLLFFLMSFYALATLFMHVSIFVCRVLQLRTILNNQDRRIRSLRTGIKKYLREQLTTLTFKHKAKLSWARTKESNHVSMTDQKLCSHESIRKCDKGNTKQKLWATNEYNV